MPLKKTKHDDSYYSETYDASVPDWPGELDFYLEMAGQVRSRGAALLEMACGTGRVALRLAQTGVNVVGLDLAEGMLEEARKKSIGMKNIRWVKGDMRSFELEDRFELVIIPGHAFHNLNTAQDQADCLECIGDHMELNGILVVHLDHQDMEWLGELVCKKSGIYEKGEQFIHPHTGRSVLTYRAWSYERSSQTAISQTRWEELDKAGKVVERHQTGPVRLHCVFPFEMEHLFARTGFVVNAVYGDFFKGRFNDRSPEMIWLASRRK